MANNVDKVSKNLLKGENIRAGIVKYLLKEYENSSVKEVKSMLSDLLQVKDSSIEDKTVTYDILFTAKLPESNEMVGIYIDIEPQGYHISDNRLVNRALYYCTRLIDRQKNNKEYGFMKDRYEDIKKVYSIWIITDERNVKRKHGKIDRIRMIEDNTDIKEEYYDKIGIILLYPEKSYKENNEEILRLISLLFSVNEDVSKKIDVLKSEYEIEVSESEEDAMYGFLDVNDDLHREQMKNLGAMKYSEGIIEGKVETAAKFISSLNLDVEQVKDILKLSDEEIKKLLEIIGK